MQQRVMISRQFNGPPKSANGGYASGVVASGLAQVDKGAAVEVSLHVPPPLDKELTLHTEGDSAVLMDGDIKVGTSKTATLSLDVPTLPITPKLIGPPVNPKGKFEPFDACFVCGNARSHGDGLCLHAEQVEGHAGLVAAPWQVHEAFAGKDGFVDPLFIWSALDCPGYFACAYGEPALLARLVVQIDAPLLAKGSAFVYGWSLGDPEAESGRKRRCGTAIVAADGTVVAKAEALWIIVNSDKIAS